MKIKIKIKNWSGRELFIILIRQFIFSPLSKRKMKLFFQKNKNPYRGYIMGRYFLLCSLIVLVLTACQKEQNLQIQQASSICLYDLQYLPLTYQVERALQHEPEADPTLLHARFEGHHYFNFSMKTKDGKGFSKFLTKTVGEDQIDKTLNDWSFKAKTDFILTSGQDTLPCVLYHLERERMAGLGMQYSLVFQAPKTEEPLDHDLVLTYQNSLLEKEGIQFIIQKENIN